MAEEKSTKKSAKSIAILNIGVIAVVAAVIALMMVFHVGAWVPFLTLCLWSSWGMKMDPKSLASEFAAIAMGLFLGYLLQHAGAIPWAMPVFMVMVVLMLLTMLNQIKPLTFVFNNYTAVFLTVGTAMSYEATIAYDYLFTLVLFGVIPLIVGLILKAKAKKAAGTGAGAGETA